MARFGLIGPSYTSQSVNADCQITRNWYVEQIESGQGKSAYALYPTPGTKRFIALPGNRVRGQLEINGRAFAISATNFVEYNAAGALVGGAPIAQVLDDFLPVSMAASPQQLLLAAGGALYVYFLQATTSLVNVTTLGGAVIAAGAVIPAGTIVQVPAATFDGPISQVSFSDGFFDVLVRNSAEFYTSTSLDASNFTTPVQNKIIVSVFTDNVQSMLVSQRRIWLLGRKQSTVYYLSGSSQVYDVDPSATIENGCVAPFGVVRADNSVFYIDQDERGAGIARRFSGYTPVRISNHAIEFAWQSYTTISDAVGYSYQDQGHTFVVWLFPTAQKTWVYDVATGMWHERAYWNVALGTFTSHRSANHVFAFGKHLVGDPQSGNVYQMAIPVAAAGGGWNFVDDNGNPIKRVRRSPVVALEFQRIFHNELTIDVETGLGPEPPLKDGTGLLRDPQMFLRWSDDSARTFSNEYVLNCGQVGNYKRRAKRSRLGSTKFGRVYEISVSDPIPWRIVEGYLDADPGFKKQPRIVKEYAKAI